MSPTQNPLAAEGTGRTAREAGAVHEDPPRHARAANRLVPDAVVRRFLRSGDRYFFPDRSLAFVDGGTRLRVRSHNAEVVHAVVAIVQARGWSAVRVTGTQAFRGELWREGMLQGITVHGHRPGAGELQELRDARERRRPARGLAAVPPRAAGAALGGVPQRVREAPRAPVTGVLLAHAAAPYRFDPAQSTSYYVRLRTAVGERTLWGTDLERAVTASRSRVRVGDAVTAAPHGAQTMKVRVAKRGEAGERVGERKVTVSRTVWSVETVQHLEARERRAQLVRDGALPADTLLAGDPELAAAAIALRLAARFAQRLTPHAGSQARFVHAVREGLARAIAEGRRIRLPVARRSERAHPPAPARA